MSRQVKVTKFGIHRSIPFSQLDTYTDAGWSEVKEYDWQAYYKKRKEREKDGN